MILHLKCYGAFSSRFDEYFSPKINFSAQLSHLEYLGDFYDAHFFELSSKTHSTCFGKSFQRLIQNGKPYIFAYLWVWLLSTVGTISNMGTFIFSLIHSQYQWNCLPTAYSHTILVLTHVISYFDSLIHSISDG